MVTKNEKSRHILGENIAKHFADKRLLDKIYKDSLKLNSKNFIII